MGYLISIAYCLFFHSRLTFHKGIVYILGIFMISFMERRIENDLNILLIKLAMLAQLVGRLRLFLGAQRFDYWVQHILSLGVIDQLLVKG